MTQTIEEVWAEVGRQNNCAVSCRRVSDITTSGGMFSRLTLEAQHGPYALLGEGKYQEWSGGSFHLQMKQLVPAKFFLRVYPWSYADLFTKGLGAQDIVLGNKPFDDAYIVKSNHVEWARLWLSSELQELILQSGEVSLSLEDDTASLCCKLSLSENLPQKLKRSIEALSAFGTQGLGFLQRWRAISQQLHATLSSTNPYLCVGDTLRLEQRGVSVSVELHQQRPGFFSQPQLYTRLSSPSQGDTTGDFWLAEEPPPRAKRWPRLSGQQTPLASPYQLRAESPERLLERLSLVEATLGALKPAALYREQEQVVLLFRGVLFSAETIQKAAELLTVFCPASAQGPYR